MVIQECFFEGNDVWVVNTGEDSHFVQGVGFLLFVQGYKPDLLECVHSLIRLPLDLKDSGICAFPKFRNHIEPMHQLSF